MPLNDPSEQRRNPDVILRKIKREERGKLTIYLGAAAGVGKTFAMLDAAHEKASEGVDVLVGWVETHGRKDTEKQLEGLERLPPREITHNGRVLQEMDLDRILEIKPQLVLVDELAHTNVPGSRHHRRFMDVDEIIEAGIDVYTTLNIQHIESLNDVVSKITGIKVHETVPDSVLENTDSVKLIDIAPEELINRLKEGKVYLPEQAQRALKNFFRVGNLSALRELSLRLTALKVDKDLSGYMHEHFIEGPWPANEKVMVCVSTNPAAATLIRSAIRLSRGLKAETIAVHIESPDDPINHDSQKILYENMSLSSELGCKNIILSGKSIPDRILEVARENNVTHIVVGKTRKSKLHLIFNDTIVDQLIHNSGGLNIYVIEIPKTKHGKSKEDNKQRAEFDKLDAVNYLKSMIFVATITLICVLLKPHIELVNIAMIYILPVLFSAYWWGKKISYFSAAASIVLFDFLFIPPVLSFTVDDIKYLWSFAILVIISFIVGKLSERLKSEAKIANDSARRIGLLYEFSSDIAGIINLEVISAKMAIKASINLEREIIIYLPDNYNVLHEWVRIKPGDASNIRDFTQVIRVKEFSNQNEFSIAKWAYEHNTPAGMTTDTLPGTEYLYMPLAAGNSSYGVMGVKIEEKQISVDQKILIVLWAKLGGIAIERAKLERQAQEAGMILESEKLRNALFSSLSHELKTPLASIKGASSTLAFSDFELSDNVKRNLYEIISDGVRNMERIINNLLDSARLESGIVSLKKEFIDIEDVIGTAVRRFSKIISDDCIDIKVDPELPLISADGALIEQVVVNLIENSLKYGKTPLKIKAFMDDDMLNISVTDSGNGVPEENLNRIFKKFFSIKDAPQKDGLGLGLSICKSIITAHKGTIEAYNSSSGGLTVHIRLPVDESMTIDNFDKEVK